jgi:rhodanese-related sulfurtransferase
MKINAVPRITCEELKQLMDKGEKVVVIDIRKSNSYNAEHIMGAINICYDPLGYPQEREMILSALPQDTPLVLYCD